MSATVLGVRLYRCISPPREAGVTAQDIADALGMHVRTAQRHLRAFERHGLVRCEPHYERHGKRIPARWWRA